MLPVMKIPVATALAIAMLVFSACKGKQTVSEPQDLPDLSKQSRPYVTVENTKVKAGPGDDFKTIGEIKRDSKVNAVGRDGEWALIVSKKGNAPGFIDIRSLRPWSGEEMETTKPPVEGPYVTLADTQVRSGPGKHYSVVAKIPKGIKINVVDEEKGWLKVESKRGNKPGYVDATLAQPMTTDTIK